MGARGREWPEADQGMHYWHRGAICLTVDLRVHGLLIKLLPSSRSSSNPRPARTGEIALEWSLRKVSSSCIYGSYSVLIVDAGKYTWLGWRCCSLFSGFFLKQCSERSFEDEDDAEDTIKDKSDKEPEKTPDSTLAAELQV